MSRIAALAPYEYGKQINFCIVFQQQTYYIGAWLDAEFRNDWHCCGKATDVDEFMFY